MFNDAAVSSNCTAGRRGMISNNESERMWQEMVVAQFESVFGHLPGR